METHAHHLHKAPGNKWTHYLFEFLMLFLAVFCGFLAENFREHQVERERGMEYIRSFYEDLKKDTARLATLAGFETEKIESLSNMQSCYDALLKNPKVTACFFDIIKNSAFNNPIEVTDRTLRQLANAGGYRLLKKEDADSILAYENAANRYNNYSSTAYQDAQNNVRNTLNRVVDFTANARLYRNITTANRDYNSSIDVPLLFSADKTLLNTYFNELFQYLRVTVGHRNSTKNLRDQAAGLIYFFKNKYRLK